MNQQGFLRKLAAALVIGVVAGLAACATMLAVYLLLDRLILR